MRKIFFLLVLASNLVIAADRDFGKEIELKNSSGKLAFGVVFSLGASDPDGSNWIITLTKNGPFPAGVEWNLFEKDSGKYLFNEWKKAFQGETFQAKASGRDAEKILPKQGELILVFRLPSGELMHLRIGDMCRDGGLKAYFKNLTDNKRCYEVTESDVRSSSSIPHGSYRPQNTH